MSLTTLSPFCAALTRGRLDKGKEAFFPEKGGSTRDAKQVCARCEVREQCLQWAIEHDERFGIWGGLSERERRRYKKEHKERA